MFKISRRLDYGMQLMIALASEKENKPVSTASLAEKLAIPLPFLHQISHSLMQAGYIKATPGPRGGLRLNHSPSTINSRQIVEALEGPIQLNVVEGSNNDEAINASFTLNLWQNLQSLVIDYLEKQKLDMLVLNYQQGTVFSYTINPVNKKKQMAVN
jgi:Rrf2 family protein